MTLENIQDSVADFAKDIRLNLASVLKGQPDGLNDAQVAAIALGSAYATRESALIARFEAWAGTLLDATHLEAVRTAAALMGMNNVYYRFLHLVEDSEYQRLPAGLRMQGIRTHGIAPLDFELVCLAISAINGCGMCIQAHAKQARSAGVAAAAVQHVVKIAAVVNAAAQAQRISAAAPQAA